MGIYTKVSGIYCITNIINNKKYVGHSLNIKKRWEGHKFHLRRGTSPHTHLQSSWNIYGENMFIFSILEIMPYGLTKQQYEEVETKWVLKFNTHKSDFGYNSVLPGTIHLTNNDENITNTNHTTISFICINLLTKEKVTLCGRGEVNDCTNISEGKIYDLANYWLGIGKRKSLNNWIVIREEDYNPEFDYIGYKKIRKDKLLAPKTWKDYEHTRKPRRKNPEDIIPREQRNLKKIPIIAVNIETGEETYYRMMKDCYKEFLQCKVYKCINAPFGKHQHRGYYFKRAEI